MTDDYKKNVLDYVLGKTDSTPSKEKEIFLEQKEIARNNWSSYLPNGWNNFRIEGIISPNETMTNLGVIYGGYITTSGETKGIIILINESFEPVKTFYKYDSGTDLRYIQHMEQSEDNTFYMVDDTAFSYTGSDSVKTSEKRFVMLNNFTLKNVSTNDYNLYLRTSYIFGNNYKNFYCKAIYKNPDSSHYVLCGKALRTDTTNGGYLQIKAIELKINVGSSNEWTLYSPSQSYNWDYLSSYVHFNNDDNVLIKMIISTGGITGKGTIYNWQKNYSSSSFSNVVEILGSSSLSYYFNDSLENQCVFLNENEIYLVINNQNVYSSSGTEHFIALYYYNFSNNSNKQLYSNNFGTSTSSVNYEQIYLTVHKGELYISFNNNINTTDSTADYYIQRYIDSWNPILIGKNKKFISTQRRVFVKSNYNLLQMYAFPLNMRKATWFLYSIKEDYNQNNYNGEKYIDYNSLNSKKNEIFSNGSLVFARNLYNFSVTNNYSISTIEIPNTYLNDVVLNENKLIGTTNLDLVDDNNPIEKNIYETLSLNYINTINVIDEDTNTNYQNASTFVNNNINTGTQENSESSKISKLRINKESGPVIQNLDWQDIDDTHKQTRFSLYIDEIVTSIDFISNDETTIYCTKDTSELEVNKIYTFTQKLRIE